MRKSLIYSFLISLILIGCVETPNNPEETRNNVDSLSELFPNSGAIVLCEGLWNYHNSDIFLYDNNQESISEAYFKKSTGKYLGDIVSDLYLLDNNRLLITATGSRQLILLNYSNAVKTNRVNINFERAAPRSITSIGQKYYYTDLYRDEVSSGIISETLSEPSITYKTGPAPEDIISYDSKLFVANSGFGDYRQKEQNAGTLQIINTNTGENEYIYIGPNLTQLSINREEKYIACGYHNTPSKVEQGDSGGIKFLDLDNNNIIRVMSIMDFADVALKESTGQIYYLSKKGLYKLNSIYSKALPQLILENNSKDIWTSLSVNEKNNEIWIANSRNYQSDGEVIVVNETGEILRRLDVGKNPRKVVFY